MPASRKGDSVSLGTSVRFEDCWAKTTPDGKPGIRVREHCLNVGCVAEALLELLPTPLRNLLPPSAAILAALHDIGKVSPGFQSKCPRWEPSFPFHAQGGYETRHQKTSQIFLDSVTNGRLRAYAEAVGAHHGRVQGDDPPGDLGGQAWEDARREVLNSLEGTFGPLPREDAVFEATKWLLAGLITLADWIGSDERNFSPKHSGALEKATQRAKAAQIVRRLGLAGAKLAGGKRFQQVFAARLGGQSPRALQQRIIDLDEPAPAIYVIEDAMGSGKTEAALWLAYRLITGGKARGLYFGLPTRVTSDRIHRRVKEFLKQVYPQGPEPPLVHGQAWLSEAPSLQLAWKETAGDGDETPEKQIEAARRWFASSRCGLLAPFAVGTVDQTLLGIIAAKWFFLRQFALAGKVVILDEVHSYDLYTGTLIQRLVKRLRELHATPIILSATLTARQRASLLGDQSASSIRDAPYPAVSIKKDHSAAELWPAMPIARPKTVRVIPLEVPDFDHVAEIVSHAARLAKAGRNVVWIRNTVHHAQEAYRLLCAESEQGAFKVGLLHSRFPAFQRASYPTLSLPELETHHLHEERWLWMLGKPEPPRSDARPKGCVLVTTQVAEQSVDIDADLMISDLAPTDMLLQRLGRLHRHDRGDRGQPTACVVVPKSIAENSDALQVDEIKQTLGSVRWVYDAYVLLRTWKEWSGINEIALPSDIRGILERTYDDSEGSSEPAAWKTLHGELIEKQTRMEGLALAATDVRGRPLGADDEGFGTRFPGQRQMPLLLARWVSNQIDKRGDPQEIQLLNGTKLRAASAYPFNLSAAKALHLNAAIVPAWWLPKAIRSPLPPVFAQYFDEGVAMAVYDGSHAALHLRTGNLDPARGICYDPLTGLWLEKRPAVAAIKDGYDGEPEDGMF